MYKLFSFMFLTAVLSLSFSLPSFAKDSGGAIHKKQHHKTSRYNASYGNSHHSKTSYNHHKKQRHNNRHNQNHRYDRYGNQHVNCNYGNHCNRYGNNHNRYRKYIHHQRDHSHGKYEGHRSGHSKRYGNQPLSFSFLFRF